jgi:hypothetical protein
LVALGLESYQPSGRAADLYARAGLDADGIAACVEEELAE